MCPMWGFHARVLGFPCVLGQKTPPKHTNSSRHFPDGNPRHTPSQDQGQLFLSENTLFLSDFYCWSISYQEKLQTSVPQNMHFSHPTHPRFFLRLFFTRENFLSRRNSKMVV